MAKKQQIILLHGTNKLDANMVNGTQLLAQGEVAIYNAADKKDVELYATNANNELVAFPSKDYTDAKVKEVADLIGNGTGSGSSIIDRLAAVETKADTNAGDIKTLQAEDKTLTGKIQENATAIGNEATRAKGVEAELSGLITSLDGEVAGNTTAIANEVARATSAETQLTASIKAITDDYLTSTDKEALQGAINAKVAQADYDVKVKALEDADAAQVVAIGKKVDTTTYNEGKQELQGAIDAKVAQADYDVKVKALGDEDARLAGLISGNTQAIAAHTETLGTLGSDVATIKGDYLKSTDKTALQTEIKKAKTEVKLAEGSTGISLTTDTNANGATVYTLKGENLVDNTAFTALDGKVTTLIGADANKSVRTIANEELAAQLIPSGATEALDTLQEIAAWIQEHPEDAAAMNLAISANTQAIADEVSRATQKEAGLQAAIDLKLNTSAYTADQTALATRLSGIDEAIASKVAQGDYNAKMKLLDQKDNDLAAGISANEQAINGLKSDVSGITNTLATKVDKTTYNEDKATLEASINGKVAQSAYDLKVKALDEKDSALQGEIDALEGVVEGKADTSTVDGINKRLGNVEKDYLKKADKTELQNAIDGKADSTTVTGISDQLATVKDTYVKQVVVKNAEGEVTQTYTPVNNVLDLTGLIIDGGTY
jgi:hypothetical protein